MNDIRFARRQLLKHPGFTAVAVLTLAIGIGANTAIFSFVNAILLRPLPYHEPEQLLMLFENHAGDGRFGPGAPIIQEWQKQNTVFEGLGVVRPWGNFTLTGRGQPEMLRGSAISASVFPLLGIQPLLGRGFVPDEEVPGKNNVVLLSYELWQRRFGGDPGIIGQYLTLDMLPRAVVGVMPRCTTGPDGERDLWVPLAFLPFELQERRAHNFLVFGRLKTGVNYRQARLEMGVIARRMAEYNSQDRGWGTEVQPLHEIIVGDSRRLLLVLLGAVGLVLLIGCANIANLQLARSAARTREFAIRAALGAGRGALIRQLLTESCVLAAIGGVLGILLARFGLEALIRFSPPDLPRIGEGIPLDGTTLAFTALITLATGILFGLIPAWQASSPVLARDLAEAARGSSGGPRRQFTRAALVVGEVALSLMLLVGAGLTIRSFGKLLTQNLGFVPEHLVTMTLSPPRLKYQQHADLTRLFDPLLSAVTNIPGVDSAAYAFGAPLTGINNSRPVIVKDAPPPPVGDTPTAGYAQVSPGYFAAMKTAFLQGRDFTERDDTNALPVVIVDETFVREFDLGEPVLGRRLDLGDGTQNAEIIGVVKDIKRVGMAEPPRGEVYRPYRQICWGPLTLVARTQRDPSDVTRAIRAELDRLDKDLPMENPRTMSQLVSANVAQRRLSVQFLGGFAGAALLLAAIGLYGVLAYTVTQRTREIGVRVALGAQRRDILGLVIGEGMRLALLGIVLGLAGAFAFARVLQRLLFEVRPTDLLTFAVVTGVLALVALFACWLPARRAANVDPIEALRNE